MANELFSIEWQGLKELEQSLSKMESEMDKIFIEEMTKFGMLAEEGTKALVHHDEGTLEDSINFDRAKREGTEFVVRGGSNSDYALRRHEEPPRTGVHDKYKKGARIKGFYVNGRGQGTLGKPRWRRYKPGRKYLEKAIKAIEPDYNKMNIRILERILETKS